MHVRTRSRTARGAQRSTHRPAPAYPRGLRVALDIAAPGAAIVLELAARRAERIMQSDERILVRRRPGTGVAHGDHPVGKADADVEVILCPVAAMTRRRRNDDVAVSDPGIEFLEARHERADTALERRRGIHVTKGNLQRQRRAATAGVGSALRWSVHLHDSAPARDDCGAGSPRPRMRRNTDAIEAPARLGFLVFRITRWLS